MIFIKVTNSGSSILISLALIGAFLYDNKITDSLFKKGNGIMGLLFGASLMYVIKGINTWAIINLAKDYVSFATKLVHSTANRTSDLLLDGHASPRIC